MMIEVALYGALAHYLPKGAQSRKATMECADGVTVAQVIDLLGIPTPHPTMLLVNGLHVGADAALKEGDRLAVFPPLAGGRERAL